MSSKHIAALAMEAAAKEINVALERLVAEHGPRLVQAMQAAVAEGLTASYGIARIDVTVNNDGLRARVKPLTASAQEIISYTAEEMPRSQGMTWFTSDPSSFNVK